MPIYEYVCSACGHRADILHGVDEAGPHFCPECGTEGSMRKAFAPPAIVFKGSGWAKKDRSATSKPPARAGDAGKKADAGAADGASGATASGSSGGSAGGSGGSTGGSSSD